MRRSRKRKLRHRPVWMSFVFGSWVECGKCGLHLASQREADQRCTIQS